MLPQEHEYQHKIKKIFKSLIYFDQVKMAVKWLPLLCQLQLEFPAVIYIYIYIYSNFKKTCIFTVLQSTIPFGFSAYSTIKTNAPTLWVSCVFLHFSDYLKYCSPVWQNSKFVQIYINMGTVHITTTYFVLCFLLPLVTKIHYYP